MEKVLWNVTNKIQEIVTIESIRKDILELLDISQIKNKWSIIKSLENARSNNDIEELTAIRNMINHRIVLSDYK